MSQKLLFLKFQRELERERGQKEEEETTICISTNSILLHMLIIFPQSPL